MTYMNGQRGFDNHYGKRDAIPCTAVYCDACAPVAVGFTPLTEAENAANPYQTQPHYGTGFSWTPVYGKPCDRCGVRS